MSGSDATAPRPPPLTTMSPTAVSTRFLGEHLLTWRNERPPISRDGKKQDPVSPPSDQGACHRCNAVSTRIQPMS
jgi:hypothetical protein